MACGLYFFAIRCQNRGDYAHNLLTMGLWQIKTNVVKSRNHFTRFLPCSLTIMNQLIIITQEKVSAMANAEILPSLNEGCSACHTDKAGNYKTGSFAVNTREKANRLPFSFLWNRHICGKGIGRMLEVA